VAAAFRFLLTVAAIVTLAGGGRAATVTGSLGVSATVVSSCTVTGGTLDFGTYANAQTADLNTVATFGYSNCSAGRLHFELSGGTYGSTSARRAGNGAGAFLNYGLFKDAARTQNFGEGASGHSVTLATSGSGSVSVYGSVPGRQTVPAGAYTDLVTITLTF
jgi:spore coat protein U-like protein